MLPKPCSVDLRERVLEAVLTGATRREAAERFEVSASSAVKWLQRWQDTGSVVAKPTGGSTSLIGGGRGLSGGSDLRRNRI